MPRPVIALTAFVLVLALSGAAAQADEPDLFALTVDPAPEPQLTYEELRVRELERKARRSRNALIGTSVATAVGLAIAISAAVTQCDSVERPNGDDDYECSRTGEALLGISSPLVVGGLTGMLITGIMLGVRKGKLRRLNDTQSPGKMCALEWDSDRGRFVF